LILPIFMMLILGMISGGIAYNQKQGLTSAAREAARYGATLPVESPCTPVSPDWLSCVSSDTVKAATGDLDVGVDGRRVCVTYIPSSGLPSTRVEDSTGSVTTSSTPCFTDGLSGKRVQVMVSRRGKLEALFFTLKNITLTAKSVNRLE
jgi:hypothetical protein